MRSFQKNSPARSSAYSEPSVIPPEQRGRDGTEGELPASDRAEALRDGVSPSDTAAEASARRTAPVMKILRGRRGLFAGLLRLGVTVTAVLLLFSLLFPEEGLLPSGTTLTGSLPADAVRPDPSEDLDAVRAESSPFDLFLSCGEDGTPQDGFYPLSDFLDPDGDEFSPGQSRALLSAAFRLFAPEEDYPADFKALCDAVFDRSYLRFEGENDSVHIYLFRIPYVTVRGEKRLFSMDFGRYTVYRVLIEDPAFLSDPEGQMPSAEAFRRGEAVLSGAVAELRKIFSEEVRGLLSDRYDQAIPEEAVPEGNAFASLLRELNRNYRFPYLLIADPANGDPRFRILENFIYLSFASPDAKAENALALLFDPESGKLRGISFGDYGISTLLSYPDKEVYIVK